MTKEPQKTTPASGQNGAPATPATPERGHEPSRRGDHAEGLPAWDLEPPTVLVRRGPRT